MYQNSLNKYQNGNLLHVYFSVQSGILVQLLSAS